MKINESNGALIESQSKLNKNRNTDNEGSFQQIMDQIASNGETTKKTLPLNINPVQIIESTTSVNHVNQLESETNIKNTLLDSLKETLDLVDFYVGKLGDTSFPAENLTSLIDQLDDKLMTIKNISSEESLPEQLRPVVSDIAVTIGSEIERYRRGDYI